MRRKGNPALVGAFVILAAAVLVGFIVFTGGFTGWSDRNERFILTFEENVYGLKKGSHVTLNGVQIGRVDRFFLGQASGKSPVPVLISIDSKLVNQHMVNDPGGIFDEEGRFNPEVIPQLRGQVQTESYVTGILYVNLEFDVESPPLPASELYGYPEIGTRVSGLKEFTDSLDPQHLGRQVNQLLKTANSRLEELDVAVIRDSFESIAQDFKRFIDTFTGELGLVPKIGATLEKLNNVLDEFKKNLSPSSEFRFKLDDTLRRVSTAAKALRSLAEFLERNPQAIIRGKGGTGGQD